MKVHKFVVRKLVNFIFWRTFALETVPPETIVHIIEDTFL